MSQESEGHGRSALYKKFSVDFMENFTSHNKPVVEIEDEDEGNNLPIQKQDCRTTFEKSNLEMIPLNSLPSEEAIFTISKICETILSYSNFQDLLKFRLASRDWRQSATNALLTNFKSYKFRIKIICAVDEDSVDSCMFSGILKSGTLEDFSKLDLTGSNSFPCNNFDIYTTNQIKNNFLFQTFLENHGCRFRTLRLVIVYFHDCGHQAKDDMHGKSICECGEEWVRRFLTRLLVEQAPNLEKCEVKFKFLPACFLDVQRKLCQPVANYDHITKKAKITPPTLNSKLKYLKLRRGHAMHLIFELIRDLAPTLTELVFKSDYDLYLKPKNQLHLLKKFYCSPEYRLEGDQDAFISKIVNMEGVLHLTLLKIDLTNLQRFASDEFCHILADVINKLFKKSCHSLKELWLSPLGFLPGLRIPRMSKLVDLKVAFLFQSPELQTSLFPKGTLMSEVFPNLHSVEDLENCFMKFCNAEIPYFMDNGNGNGNGNGNVLPSVKVLQTNLFPQGMRLAQVLPNLHTLIDVEYCFMTLCDATHSHCFDDVIIPSVKVLRSEQCSAGEIETERLLQIFPNAEMQFKD